CVNAQTGKLVWKAAAQERLGPQGTFYSTPAVSYGRVYIGSTAGKGYLYGAKTGKPRRSHSTGHHGYAAPAGWREPRLLGVHRRRGLEFRRGREDLRLGDRPGRRRLLLDARAADLRPGREDRPQALDVQRRQVRRRDRRPRAPVPDGVHAPLRDAAEEASLIG